MNKLKYLGPNSSIYLGEGKERKAKPLITGVTYDNLPEEHKTVKTLIARGLLVSDEDNKDEKETAKPIKPLAKK